MSGWLGGVTAGTLVSVLALGALSVLSEQPAGVEPPAAPLVDAPDNDVVEPDVTPSQSTSLNTPVGAISIEAPVVPDLPETEAVPQNLAEPDGGQLETPSGPADTDPLDVPDVTSIEGAMDVPVAPEASGLIAQPIDPVLPNPQSQPPQTPDREVDLTILTAPDEPVVVVLPDPVVPDPVVPEQTAPEPEEQVAALAPVEDFFVLDLEATENAFAVVPQDLGPVNALEDFAAQIEDTGDRPLMSFVLVDTGEMPAAIAALSALPFPVTIALDPSLPQAAGAMQTYREEGFEVVALAEVDSGVDPDGVEQALDGVFRLLTDAIAVLDLGQAGLNANSGVTGQAMEILAAQGRGFISATERVTLSVRTAEATGVHTVGISRDLDGEGQDARIIRRFIEQGAFRARRNGSVVLVGRMQPDTISALILWGSSNPDEDIAIVPISAILKARQTQD